MDLPPFSLLGWFLGSANIFTILFSLRKLPEKALDLMRFHFSSSSNPFSIAEDYPASPLVSFPNRISSWKVNPSIYFSPFPFCFCVRRLRPSGKFAPEELRASLCSFAGLIPLVFIFLFSILLSGEGSRTAFFLLLCLRSLSRPSDRVLTLSSLSLRPLLPLSRGEFPVNPLFRQRLPPP